MDKSVGTPSSLWEHPAETQQARSPAASYETEGYYLMQELALVNIFCYAMFSRSVPRSRTQRQNLSLATTERVIRVVRKREANREKYVR